VELGADVLEGRVEGGRDEEGHHARPDLLGRARVAAGPQGLLLEMDARPRGAVAVGVGEVETGSLEIRCLPPNSFTMIIHYNFSTLASLYGCLLFVVFLSHCLEGCKTIYIRRELHLVL
jgi:hypothetical protein